MREEHHGEMPARTRVIESDEELFAMIDEHTERAMQYHAEHGVWPPDPLLDEVDDMRRQIMAEHGHDWQKVLQWHADQDRLLREQTETETRSAGVVKR